MIASFCKILCIYITVFIAKMTFAALQTPVWGAAKLQGEEETRTTRTTEPQAYSVSSVRTNYIF